MTPAEQKERDRLDKLACETLLTIANREADRIEALNAEISALLSQNGKLREALEELLGWADTMGAAYPHPFLNDNALALARAALSPLKP